MATKSDSSTTTNNNKQSKRKPTHFLTARIYNPEIINNAVDFFDQIQDWLKPACVDIDTLHLTMSVITCTSPQDIENTISAMGETVARMQDEYRATESKILEFDGLKTFGGGVLFVAVRENPGIKVPRDYVYFFWLRCA